MARRANKKDANHATIARELGQCGALVLDAASAPALGFDMLVAYRGRLYILEVKDGAKVPSARRLTPGEAARREQLEAHGVDYHIVHSTDEALKAIGATT